MFHPCTSYGETLSSAGTATTPYTFTGEWQDATGLVYLLARYYAPWEGRFTTKDVWLGDMMQPMSFNQWAYAFANPVWFTDPSGNIPCAMLPPGADQLSCQLSKLVTFSSDPDTSWIPNDQIAIRRGVADTAFKLARLVNGMGYSRIYSAPEVFGKVFGFVNFYQSDVETWNDTNGNGLRDRGEYYYCERASGTGGIPPGVMCHQEARGNITARLTAHELGHVYNASIANQFSGIQTPYRQLEVAGIFYADQFGEQIRLAGNVNGEYVRLDLGVSFQENPTALAGEDFADMFANWVYGGFRGAAGEARNVWLTSRLQADMIRIFGTLAAPNPLPLPDPLSPRNNCLIANLPISGGGG